MTTKALGYRESIALAEKYGIETPVQVLFSSADEIAAYTSGRMQYPLVLKAILKDAGHKTELSLVVTNLRSHDEVLDAFSKMSQRTLSVELECYVLQEQVRGVEFIVGGKKDPVFSQTLMFGMGGVYVELTSDFSIRVCPVDYDTAGDMLNETKARAFFTEAGFRGHKASRPSGAEFLMKTSKLLEDNKDIVELDFNPVIATPEKFYAVDLRIIRQEENQ